MRPQIILFLLTLAASILGCKKPENSISSAYQFIVYGELDSALITVKKVLDIDSLNPEALMISGMIANESGDIEGAFGYFSKVITIDPTNANAHYLIGRYYWGKLDEPYYNRLPALDYFNKAIELNSKNPKYYIDRANYYLTEYDIDSIDLAIRDFTKAINLNPRSPNGYMQRSEALNRKGDKEAAKSDLKKCAELGSPLAKALLRLDDIQYGEE
jgi:tetratricopeptide (TPR) repeat protein